ncbi:MAG: nitroreductase, partial [Clostridiales bacterium]|jgi:putative NAD(P)H nitroreductase|nr:nitroreductase [Clostridiales bacterium]
MSELLNVVRERRSANKFIENIEIPKKTFEDIFSELTSAPSAFNLQHANYYVVQKNDVKEEIYKAAFNQYKVKTSSATIIVTGDKKAYQNATNIYEGSLMIGILDELEFNNTIKMINDLYEGWGETFQYDEAVRNASLSAMLFMLLAKDNGWDTCPMIYFDKEKVSEILNIPDNETPVLMITMGKIDPTSYKVRGARKDPGEFVKYF